MSNHHNRLQRLKNHYHLRRIGELILLSLGGALLTYALINGFSNDHKYVWIIALMMGLILFTGRYLQLRLHRLSTKDIASYLNRRFETLEDSTDLLTISLEELGPLQQIQRKRLQTAFEAAAQNIEWPQQWGLSTVVLILGLLAYWSIHSFGHQEPIESFQANVAAVDSSSSPVPQSVPAELKAFTITARPPTYTGLGTLNPKEFNLKIPEGSQVSWRLEFSGMPLDVMMIFSSGDSTDLSRDGSTFSLSRSMTQSGYYSVDWGDQEKLKSTDFYKLEIVPDQEPKVTIDNQDQFVTFPWKEQTKVVVKSTLLDDYGLTEAYVIATVSKGNGESVKFREERLPFDRPKQFLGKQAQATLELNTKSLGMEPGDELYYYVEAWDNRTPQRQSNRTETYFIQLQDTSTQMISFEGGLGADLMPEYFRSQRQIIIDSERLLTEKAAIEQKEFRERSNSLAYDQKVLRLRYGQFLGEEFESGMTAEPQVGAAAPENEEETLEQYGHTHDTDNEHNLVEEHEHEPDESLNPEGRQESSIEAFSHSHDNMEEATFFIQSIKAKLRAALSMMWDAELHLRMNDPAQSLPFQYKILKLLKEISNDSRIYVHRTGFDQPPLKEEKRLTGVLGEISSSQVGYIKSNHQVYPAIQLALPLIERLLQDRPIRLETSQKEMLLAAGNELAGAAIEQPNLYLARLRTLRLVLDGEANERNLREVRKAFWMLLPQLPRAVAGKRNTAHGLQDAFIQQLKVQSYR